MTFVEIQNKVLALMDEEGDTGTILTNTKTFINSALQNRALERKWSFMLSDETTLSVAAGEVTATLPADFNTMHWVKDSEDRLQRQLPLEQRFVDTLGDWESVTSREFGDYVLRGNVIHFLTLSTSHAGTDYTIQYYKFPEELVDDSDIPDFPTQFHDLLIWDAVIGLKGYHAELDNIEFMLEQQRRAEHRLYVSNFGADSVGHSPKQVRYIPV
jgi:hypothetical protein